MSVLNKLMDAIRVSDFEEDELLDEIEDEEEDDFLEEEVKPKKSFMERFSSRKSSRQEDDYLDDEDLDDEEEDAYSAPSPSPARKASDSFSSSPSFSVPKPAAAASAGRTASSKPSSSKITPMRQSRRTSGGLNDMYVQVLRPANYDDGAKSIADYLLKNYTIVLNLEGLDLDLAQRLIDFTSGCTYALNGTLQKASNYIFIIGPSNVEIGGDIQNILGGNMAVARAGY